MAPKLQRVIRLDSIPLNKAYYTPEGYLRDNPILTTTGIFEYHNSDGSVRRELRLPDEVFAPESLASYEGKPIIITHDAGLIDKDNVYDESIGTILTKGERDGENVRAQIVIHDTDEMKDCGLKELSLGYNLDLEETPGVWNGEHYDAIQRNIIINHLALVREARAGDNARLNIDSRDKNILKGGAVSMKKQTTKRSKKNAKRSDGVLSQEDFAAAIEKFKARRAERMAAKADEEEVVSTKPAEETDDDDEVVTSEDIANAETIEEMVELIKDRRDRRDSEGDPETVEEANGVIANQDEDIDYLFDIIDTLLAEKDFNAAKEDEDDVVEEDDDDDDTDEEVASDEDDETAEDEDDEDTNNDDDDESETDCEEEVATDDDDDDIPSSTKESVNADSVDRMVRDRVELNELGKALNLDGLDKMNIKKAKKKVIKKVSPSARLDGKSDAYIDGMFRLAADQVKSRSRKDTAYQMKQMFNGDGKSRSDSKKGSKAARQRMIDRQFNQK